MNKLKLNVQTTGDCLHVNKMANNPSNCSGLINDNNSSRDALGYFEEESDDDLNEEPLAGNGDAELGSSSSDPESDDDIDMVHPNWSGVPFNDVDVHPFIRTVGPVHSLDRCAQELYFFRLYFSTGIIIKLVTGSNRYATQQGASLDTTLEEISEMLGKKSSLLLIKYF